MSTVQNQFIASIRLTSFIKYFLLISVVNFKNAKPCEIVFFRLNNKCFFEVSSLRMPAYDVCGTFPISSNPIKLFYRSKLKLFNASLALLFDYLRFLLIKAHLAKASLMKFITLKLVPCFSWFDKNYMWMHNACQQTK